MKSDEEEGVEATDEERREAAEDEDSSGADEDSDIEQFELGLPNNISGEGLAYQERESEAACTAVNR